MSRRRWARSVLRAAPVASLLLLAGCASMVGYSAGRIIDTQFSRATPPPACGRHALRQGQRVTLVLTDGTRQDGLYLWHDCEGDSLLVMKTEVSNWDMPGRHADTLRVPLRTIDHVDVPREQARYVGMVLGVAFDAILGLWMLVIIGLGGVS